MAEQRKGRPVNTSLDASLEGHFPPTYPQALSPFFPDHPPQRVDRYQKLDARLWRAGVPPYPRLVLLRLYMVKAYADASSQNAARMTGQNARELEISGHLPDIVNEIVQGMGAYNTLESQLWNRGIPTPTRTTLLQLHLLGFYAAVNPAAAEQMAASDPYLRSQLDAARQLPALVEQTVHGMEPALPEIRPNDPATHLDLLLTRHLPRRQEEGRNL